MLTKTFFVALALAAGVQASPAVCSSTVSCNQGYYSVAATTTADAKCVTCTKNTAIANQHASATRTCAADQLGQRLTEATGKTKCLDGYYHVLGASGADDTCVTCTKNTAIANQRTSATRTCAAGQLGQRLTEATGSTKCNDGYYHVTGASGADDTCVTCTKNTAIANQHASATRTCAADQLGQRLTAATGSTKCADGYYWVTGASGADDTCVACPATGTGLVKPTNTATGAVPVCLTVTSGWTITAAPNGAKCADGYYFVAKTGTDPQSDSCTKCTFTATSIAGSCCGLTCTSALPAVALQTTWAPTTCPGTVAPGGQSDASTAALSMAALMIVAALNF